MRSKLLLCLLFGSTLALAANDVPQRLSDSTTVIKEIMETPDKSIPQDLMNKAQCVVVVPGVKKAAFIIGAKYGRGFFTCRGPHGVGWTAPAAIRVEGGSFGFQIGGSETDVVMLVMNEGGMSKLLKDKFTLGADASVAAGPVGRTSAAETDAMMHAEILSWSRARGVFAGIALNGATLRPDDESNKVLYGRPVTNSELAEGKVKVPAVARSLIAQLNKYSSRKTG
jgi:lipid-binding SYLF domain-containing protein